MPITTTEAAAAIPEFWLAEALGRLKANLVMGLLVRRDADSEVAQVGDTVNVIKRGSLTVKDKSEGSAVTADSPTNTKVAVTLDKHKYVAWHLEDNAGAKAVDAALDYIADGMSGLAEAIESDLLALYTDIATEVGTAGTDLDAATILAARKALNEQRAPMQGRHLIVSPKDEVALLAIDKFTKANERGDGGQALSEASLGRLFGFDTYMSQMVPVTAGTPDSTHNIAFHGNAFMLVTRPLPLPAPGSGAIGAVMADQDLGIAMRYTRQWDSDQLATKHVIDVLYGVKSIDEDRLAVEVLG